MMHNHKNRLGYLAGAWADARSVIDPNPSFVLAAPWVSLAPYDAKALKPLVVPVPSCVRSMRRSTDSHDKYIAEVI